MSAAAVAFVLAAASPAVRQTPPPPASAVLAQAISPMATRFGLAGAGSGMRAADVVARARELGLSTIEWSVDLSRPARDPDLGILAASGMGIVLSVDPGRLAPPELASAIGQALDAWRPVLLVVGGPESPGLFRESGTEPFLATVKVACAAARERKVPCTTGGLMPRELALLVWNHHRSAGRADVARAFVARTLPASEERLFSPHPGERVEESLARGRALLRGYAAAGADYVNVRWSLADPVAFGQAVDFARLATGLPVVSTALGDGDCDPDRVPALLEEVRRQKIALALWPARDLGTAFRAFVRDRTRLGPR